MSLKLNKILVGILFLLSVHVFYKYTGIYEHLHKRPCSIHSWAQICRASIALNYYQGDMNFFKPQIHKALDGEGITGLEFPLVNYSAAVLYKIFGFDEFYYKVFVLLTLVFGLLCFFYLTLSYTNSVLLSVTGVMAAYVSPVLLYYSANFLPDTTSLGFVLAAWFFFLQYTRSKKKNQLILFFVFALLATLVKATSIMVFCVLFGLIVLDYLKFFKKSQNNVPLIAHKAMCYVLSALSLCIFLAWYKYANWLTEHYHADAFLTTSMPLPTKVQIMETWKYVKERWVPDYYYHGSYLLIACSAILLIPGYKYVNRVLFTITLLTWLGSACFVYAMFVQFKNHDYYIIPLLTCVFLLLLTFVDFINRLANTFFPPLKIIAFFILLFNVTDSSVWCRDVYQNRHSVGLLAYIGDYRAYENLEPHLRKLGIKPHDITLSAFDNTYCNSLYLMNQRGWPVDYTASKDWIEWIFKTKNIQYMVLKDSASFNKIYPNNFKDKLISQYNGLLIYKLK